MTTNFVAGPAELQNYLRSVEAALRAGDMPRAMQLSGEAVSRGHAHLHLLTLAAHYHLAANAGEYALDLATRARALAPKNADVLNVLGLSLAQLGRFREAVECYDTALRHTPNAAMIRLNKAAALEELDEFVRARREFERVLDSQPAHAGALASLAFLAAQRGEMKAARDYAERALRSNPREAAAHLVIAQADIEQKKFEGALSRLKPFTHETNPSAINRTIAQGLSGDALEGLDRTAEAFAAYSASQASLRARYRPFFEQPGIENARDRIRRLTAYFDGARKEDLRASDGAATGTHVFLVGFPRSGTTLLEQVLASHSDIEAMQERDCLIDAANEFLADAEGLDRLASLDGTALEPWRAAYWKRVADHGIAPRRAIFVDKLPLNSVLLCLIAKLFPRSKILFALRDPRDVVLSCFRRRFGMNPQMYELTTLEGAAAYYDAVMQLCEIYRAKLGLEWFDIRYEGLVGDFAGTTERLCAFLGVAWSDQMSGFAERAKSGAISTPSAPQVARGLFTQGMGQWRRYRQELAPVLPRLAPWVSRFDYAAD